MSIQPKQPTGESPFKVEKNFLGTRWDFVTRKDGTAYWVNTRTLKIVESSRSFRTVRNGEQWLIKVQLSGQKQHGIPLGDVAASVKAVSIATPKELPCGSVALASHTRGW
jgi:hypothetical protein